MPNEEQAMGTEEVGRRIDVFGVHDKHVLKLPGHLLG